MANIRAFRGLRYSPEVKLDSCICPPYDIISDSEREELYRKSEYNIIRVEFGKEFEGDNAQNNKFTRAKEYLDEWIQRGILRFEDKESVYVLEQEFEIEGRKYRRTGLIVLLELVDFEEGIVIPHEFTLSKPKQERLNLLRHTHANISSIFGLYEDKQLNIKRMLDDIKARKENVSYNGIGTFERIWIVSDDSVIENLKKLFADKKIFIADGHHRYETALEYKKEMMQRKDYNKDADYNYIMITLTALEDEGIVILPTHRIVLSSDVEEDIFLEKLKINFDIEEGEYKALKEKLLDYKKYAFLIYTYNKNFYLIRLKDPEKSLKDIEGSRAYKNLDVVVLQKLILSDILGITDEDILNQRNLKYTKSDKELIDIVDGGAKYGFILNPTLAEELKEVSLSGEKMPQKSTYFYPKLMTGNVIFVHQK
ncbi:uncharacterized conserved protein UCP033563 [Caldicellulosiruptor saccharolyticus DSM 8903]|uniref:Uncharacterized conserved protein UCP033563 n=1 Tax=Caldicellulosiruptor saccharolyticus (strain ATCC 43494 / DSM 8903 / Tp8T 6331) TaxID=351627 RepID=A4XJ22_CALS8|nr:DUF1015 domain-containing protein [Caldicellulosiruptor saccharolyticus]ABP66907.1 uncharacterized conserved protein UCP033563 [Caldicellulosiruptor saccharolyticus DSM 8903]